MNPAEVQSLKMVTRCYYDYQEEELRLRGILGVKKDDEPKKNARPYDPALSSLVQLRLDEVAKQVISFKAAIVKEVRKHPLWTAFLKGVKGCGETMAAVILTEIDIHRADTVSKLWQFAGMNPGEVRGKKWGKRAGKKVLLTTNEMVCGDRPTEGFLRPYNDWLRAKMLGVLATEFHMSKSDYLIYYRNYKHRLESSDWGNESKNPTDPNRPKAGHQHKAANRYMIKMFLRDLYDTWRKLEGLPVRAPYQDEYLSHKHHEPVLAMPAE